MPIFAPAYRPTTHSQTFLARQQKLIDQKRKRVEETTGDEGHTSEEESSPEPSPRAYHPINQKDPYHIAGLSREDSLPPAPFPHAALKDSRTPKPSLDEDLATQNPPLYLPPSQPDSTTSSRRRHLDNLTTILHTSLLRRDYTRASRAWSILVRTEVSGRSIDIRRHGRWGIGAELLMRSETVDGETFSEKGFRLARQYYERLVLQYPHTAQSQYYARENGAVNAAVVYPALFEVWVAGAVEGARRAREGVVAKSSDEASVVDGSQTEDEAQIRAVRAQELEQALPIARRMDELLLSPPYDTNPTLLELRGMVALWIADLHTAMAKFTSDDMDASIDSVEEPTSPTTNTAEHHNTQAFAERLKARDTFAKLTVSGAELHSRVQRIIQDFSI